MIKVEEILKQLVLFDTVGDKENGKIMDWIGKFCTEAGFETEKIKSEKDGKACLVARAGKPGKNGLVFIGHTDTVPAADGWKTEPFVLTQMGNDFFGLGASDMKGGIAAMLAAVSEVDLQKLHKGLELIFTYDEENNLAGIKNVLSRHKVLADCIVIGEPTSLEPVVATKGALALKIKFIGKDAHGSNPEVGVNAIEMASGFIVEMKKYFKNIAKEHNDIFDNPRSTLNIAQIAGGDAMNKVPSLCTLGFEMRLIDNRQREKIMRTVADIIKKNGFKAKVEIDISLPVAQCSDRKFIAAVEAVTKKKAVGVSYATEGSLLPSANNFVILGPGSIKVAHRADEFVSKSSLNKAVKVYGELINKFCA